MEEAPFLTAEWRHVAMLNYEVERSVLAPRVPRGTELDDWNGRTYLSMVGFLFLNTRVLGLPIPFHRNFEEVNLRFYVRRRSEDGWRRGVVFVKEIVPLPAVALVARALYNERYVALPMGHEIVHASAGPGTAASVTYRWRAAGRENSISVTVAGEPQPLAAGSHEEFIAEHYWGYSVQRGGAAAEYRVAHPPWRVAPALRSELDCDVGRLYGGEFAAALGAAPASAFLAAGSEVAVFRGVRLDR